MKRWLADNWGGVAGAVFVLALVGILCVGIVSETHDQVRFCRAQIATAKTHTDSLERFLLYPKSSPHNCLALLNDYPQ